MRQLMLTLFTIATVRFIVQDDTSAHHNGFSLSKEATEIAHNLYREQGYIENNMTRFLQAHSAKLIDAGAKNKTLRLLV